MPWEEEVDAGLGVFKAILRSTGVLELQEARKLGDRMAYYLVIGRGQKKTDMVLTCEFLSDLPNTAEHKNSTQAYARRISKRIANPHPMDYYCKTGVPIRVEIEWPFNPVPMRAAAFVQVSIYNLSKPSTLAICSVIKTHQQDIFYFRKNPFLQEAAIFSTARRAVDGQKLTFHTSEAHPDRLQELPLDTRVRPETPETAIDRFIAGKVYWMGFKQGDRRTKVWIADDADADYLGVDRRSLLQTAQVLEAQKMVVLDSTQEYASAGEQLLVQAKSFGTGSALSAVPQGPVHRNAPTRHDWDCFICHASEDKNDFVRPLAQELRRSGLKVWYDEFTLKVGDSLRREIDRGLRDSRYGVVVLSPAFFAKGWSQWELDGLVAKEVDGEKVILPIWHNVTAADVRKYSLPLADKVAAQSSEGIVAVVAALLRAIKT